jgi:hypothetical protein
VLWRKRRWRYLLSRIDHLPRNSAYVEALSLDEELAAQVASRPPVDKPGKSSVNMRDWSPLLEMLTVIADRQADIIQAIIASQGGKPPKIRPLPRPKTAIEKLSDPRLQHQKILSRVMIQQPDGSVVSAADAGRARMPALPLP